MSSPPSGVVRRGPGEKKKKEEGNVVLPRLPNSGSMKTERCTFQGELARDSDIYITENVVVLNGFSRMI